MPGKGWRQVRVDELVRRGLLVLNDGYRVRNVELGPVGIPFVRGGDINGGGVNTEVEDHIRPEFTDRVRSKLSLPFDVAFITKGTVGRVGIVRPGQPPSVFAPQVCYWRSLDHQQIEPRFLYYLLCSAEFQSNLDAVKTHGSMAADYVSLTDQRGFRLTFPPIGEQRAIASILGALDDKIELNRQMNVTLEAIARSLFQSWFVDFDPARAKLEGCRPVTPHPTSDLFPSAFQDSALGRIPKGWQTGSILGQADLLSGGTPKTGVPEYWDGNVSWASAKDVSQCGEAFLVSTERTITELGVVNSSTRIIPEYSTVVVARGATTGRLAMFGSAMAMNQTCYGLRSKVGAPFALYCNARHFIDRLVQGGHGSIFDTITTSTFQATNVLLPPAELLRAFDAQVAPLFNQIRANIGQSRTLAALRDTLLPKLLSGELSPTTDSVIRKSRITEVSGPGSGSLHRARKTAAR